MRRRTRVALALTATLPVLGLLTGPNTTLLMYTIFVLALFQRDRLRSAIARIPLPPRVVFALAIILSGWCTEILAWFGSYLAKDAHPALLHPQLFADLILAVGFYGGWAVAWLLLLRRWRFSLPQVFVVTGVMGIVVEQSGAIFVRILSVILVDPLQAVLYALDLFLVYGSIMGLAAIGTLDALATPRQRGGWLRFIVAPLAMFLGSTLFTVLVGLIAMALGLMPPRQSIIAHPFW